MDDERILITGAGGMLGRSLTQLLEARGRSPLTLDRGRLDIADESSVARVFAKHRPTLLLNCAAHTKVDLCEEHQDLADAINGHAAGLVARPAKRQRTSLVFSCSDSFSPANETHDSSPDVAVATLSAYIPS